MFAYCLLQGLPSGITIYFLQYFMQDVIEKGPEGYDLNLFGVQYDSTKSAESATALVNIATSWSQLLTSLVTKPDPLLPNVTYSLLHAEPRHFTERLYHYAHAHVLSAGWWICIEPDRSKVCVGVLADSLGTFHRLSWIHVKLH